MHPVHRISGGQPVVRHSPERGEFGGNFDRGPRPCSINAKPPVPAILGLRTGSGIVAVRQEFASMTSI
jgi:hypothetical protein